MINKNKNQKLYVLIVNAVAHRDYHVLGTDIQIKMFDGQFVVESSGTLPGLIRINNMRNMNFSRNPVIARYLRDYKVVRELGEGVDRMHQWIIGKKVNPLKYRILHIIKIKLEVWAHAKRGNSRTDYI